LTDTVRDALDVSVPGLEIVVLRGFNRWETADLINARVTNPRGTFLIGYQAVPDAVSAASYAAANGYLIKLAGADGTFTGDITGNGYILGGPTLVKDFGGLTRLYGSDRYATNETFRKALLNEFSYDNMYVANGTTLAEALVGSALAAKTKSVVVLAPQNNPAGIDFVGITPATKVYALGQ
jgi:hypothetical protein